MCLPDPITNERLVERFGFLRDRTPTEFLFRSQPSRFAEPRPQLFVSHQFVDFDRQVTREFFRMKGLERAFLHLRNRHKKTGFTVYYHFLNATNLAGNNGRLARHCFQVNDAKRFVD